MAFGLPSVRFIGFPAPALVAAHAGLGYREARPRDLPAVRAHFFRLSAEDRRRRFCATLSQAALEAYAAAIWSRPGLTLVGLEGPVWPGFLHRAGPVRALAELTCDRREAEIGLSVDAGMRRRGVGGYLVQAAGALLAPRGVARLFAYTTGDNMAMLRLARRSGARIDRSGAEVEIVFDAAALRLAYLRRRFAAQLRVAGL